MHLRALIVSNLDNTASGHVRRTHLAALDALAARLGRHGIATIIIDGTGRHLSPPCPADLIFILSPMICWYPGLRSSVEWARRLLGNRPVIIVETLSTLSLRHALETSGADYVHKGEVGEALGFVLNTFGYRLRRR